MLSVKRISGVVIPVVAGVILFFTSALFGQSATPEELSAASARYEPAFITLEEWLETAPAPQSGFRDERERMLKLIDEPLAYPDAKSLPCVREFFRTRMEKFMEEFEDTKVESGVVVWKLYNHTEIIQTPKIKIAVDLIRGFDGVEWDRDLLKRLVDGLDVLLITHRHGDHADPRVVEMFLESGKPVVVPEVFLSVSHLKPKLIVMREGELKFPGAAVRVFPSWQKMDMVSVYLITTDEGYKVMHLGDENELNQAGHEWYRKLKEPLDIDILIPNIWCPNIATLLWSVRPKLIIASHEHELWHDVGGRRSYDYVYKVLRTIGLPYAVPAWGEAVRYRRGS